MSTTLAVVLMAGMAVPGDVPGEVSAETDRKLDLSGEWEGEWRHAPIGVQPLRFADGQMYGQYPRLRVWREKGTPFRFVDEGGGNLRFTLAGGEDSLGIYRQDGDRLVACFGYTGRGRTRRRMRSSWPSRGWKDVGRPKPGLRKQMIRQSPSCL